VRLLGEVLVSGRNIDERAHNRLFEVQPEDSTDRNASPRLVLALAHKQTTMGLHNPDGQSHASALRLGREEHLEHALGFVGGKLDTRITHCYQ
jgi:hypothetical protein